MRQMVEKGYDYNTDLLYYLLTSECRSIEQAEINCMWNTVNDNKAHKYYINDNTPRVFIANKGSRPFFNISTGVRQGMPFKQHYSM